MHHVIAWSEGVAAAGTLQQLTGVPDDQVFTEGDDFRIPAGYDKLLAAWALGTGTTRARIVAPSLRAFINHEIAPVTLAQTVDAEDPIGWDDLVSQPLALAVGEAINAESDGGAAGPEDVSVIVLLGAGALQPVTGDIRTLRATAAIVGTRRVWTGGNLIFSEDLPAGRYAVVGGRCQMNAANGAWRLIPRDGGLRPGGLCSPTIAALTPFGQRFGRWGVWMEFDVNQPPRLEVLSFGAASATQVVYLDLIRVR